jgi:hypothetical protein
MRSRPVCALLLLTLPVWFLPALLWVGWKEAGRDVMRDVIPGLRWAILGRKPEGY